MCLDECIKEREYLFPLIHCHHRHMETRSISAIAAAFRELSFSGLRALSSKYITIYGAGLYSNRLFVVFISGQLKYCD